MGLQCGRMLARAGFEVHNSVIFTTEDDRSLTRS